MAQSKRSRMIAVDVDIYIKLKLLSELAGCTIKNIANQAMREYLREVPSSRASKGFRIMEIFRKWLEK